jgi:hypothetical protein
VIEEDQDEEIDDQEDHLVIGQHILEEILANQHILRKILEIKKIFEQRKHLEPRPRMWEKRISEVRKVSEITHQEDHLKNSNNIKTLYIITEFFYNLL